MSLITYPYVALFTAQRLHLYSQLFIYSQLSKLKQGEVNKMASFKSRGLDYQVLQDSDTVMTSHSNKDHGPYGL